MLIVIEDWLEKTQSYWEQCNVQTIEIKRLSPPDYPIYLIVIQHETIHAAGSIEIRGGNGEDGNLHQMDFQAITMNEQSFYRYYEFTDSCDACDFDKWQQEYISFICGV